MSKTAEAAPRPIESPEELFPYFPGAQPVEPDPVCRPAGDTTVFTTAGVQRVETILRERGRLERETFAVAQPVVRSQYMDRAKEGTSSAFVNFSVIQTESTVEGFAGICRQLSAMVVDRGADPGSVTFKVETLGDRWGDREFTKTVLTLYVAGTEVGEGVYLHDYPATPESRVAITDVCFGVERLNWAVAGGRYFRGFEPFYEGVPDPDVAGAAIDSLRSATLVAGEGVLPSHVDPGFRLRRLCKRFAERNVATGIAPKDLIAASYGHWQRWGERFSASPEQVEQLLCGEIDRAFNNLLIAKVAELGGPKISMNVNQSSESFVVQAKRSLKEETKQIFLAALAELSREGK